MLLDLQAAPPAPGVGGETVKPARQLPATPRAAAAAAHEAASVPTDATAAPETVEESGSPAAPTRWSSLNGDAGAADTGSDPGLGGAKSAHDSNPSVLRRMVSA
ncbi:hypothetical protein CLD22_27045, partial [Rubrivivax gelatinosus]|nr:hypothetical protein [Rubrivivax gelatinosus]